MRRYGPGGADERRVGECVSPRSATSRGRPALSGRSVFWSSFVAFCLLGAVWALGTPLLSSPDEPVQVIRAASLWRGDLRGRIDIRVDPNPEVFNATLDWVDLPLAYSTLWAQPACYVNRPDVSAQCVAPLVDDDRTLPTSTYVGSYPPFYYLVVGWPTFLPAIQPALYGMRLASVVACAALLALGLHAARRADAGGRLVAGVLVATTPMTMALAGAVNPSSIEVASAVALLATLFELWRGGPVSRSLAARTAVAAGALVLTRPLSPVLLVTLVGLTAVAVAGPSRLRQLAGDRRVRVVVGTVAALFVSAIVWMLWSRDYAAFTGYPRHDLGRGAALRGSVEALPERARQMIGVFGWLDTPLPTSVYLLWAVVLTGLVVAAVVVATNRARLALALAGAGTVAFTVVPEALRATTYGYYWQGRDSLPLAVSVPILAAAGLGIARRPARRPAPSARWLAVAVVALLSTHLVAVLVVLRRFRLGTGHSLLEAVTAPGWDPPIGPVPLIMATVAAVVVLAVVAVPPLLHPSPGEPPGEEEEERPRAPVEVAAP